MKSINPTTGEVIKSYTEHSWEKQDHLVHQVDFAFHAWSRLPMEERSAKFMNTARILRRDAAYFAELMANEMGKPLKQGEAEIEKCAWACESYAQQAMEFLKDEPVKTGAQKSFIHFEPLGVVLAIMPWNFPFWQVFRCAAPILMAGNAIVLKHAPNVCGCALAIENIFKLCDFPDGIIRSVFVDNDKAGKLIEHPLIRAVTLTGSVGAGKAVAGKAGSVLKKTVLELGGSDAYIILEDAPLEESVDVCVSSRMNNAGQSCVAAKRFIVVESLVNQFEELMVKKITEYRMGSPLQEGVTLGPLARHDLRDKLHEQVQASVKLGARLLTGGVIPEAPGAFYPPTVLSGVMVGMPAYYEELFGPVAAIITVKDEAEALRVANDSDFGLGAAVFTGDVQKGERIAVHELQAGCCFVNSMVQSDPRLPFGGIKQSGYGRELGVFGIREFVNVKTVYVK